jgi:hypothetical protein
MPPEVELDRAGSCWDLERSVADPTNYRRGSQPYLPPPPETRDDSPESVDVPRMEPPPASLEAMMRSGPGPSAGRDRGSTWLWISMLLAVAAVITVYVLRSAH